MAGRSTGTRCGEVLNSFVAKLPLRSQLCLRPVPQHPGHVKSAEKKTRLRGRWGRVHEALIRFDSSMFELQFVGFARSPFFSACAQTVTYQSLLACA